MAYTLNGSNAKAFLNGSDATVRLNGNLVYNPVKEKKWQAISYPGTYNGTYDAGINNNTCLSQSGVLTRLPNPNNYEVGYILRVTHKRMIPPFTISQCDAYYFKVIEE